LQILAEEHHRIQAARGDVTTYFTKSTGKGKKRGDVKKCSHCKCKGHDVSKCWTLKKEQEEEATSGSNAKSNSSSSGKLSGKLSSKLSGKLPSKASTKIAEADDSSSDSDETVQVFMAHAAPIQEIEHVYKTKAELH